MIGRKLRVATGDSDGDRQTDRQTTAKNEPFSYTALKAEDNNVSLRAVYKVKPSIHLRIVV
jgi:hypothetical protein